MRSWELKVKVSRNFPALNVNLSFKRVFSVARRSKHVLHDTLGTLVCHEAWELSQFVPPSLTSTISYRYHP